MFNIRYIEEIFGDIRMKELTPALIREREAQARKEGGSYATGLMLIAATVLYLYDLTVPEGESKDGVRGDLHDIFSGFNSPELFQENGIVFSSIGFIKTLTEGFNLS